jgi:hypothetical protein
MPWKNAGELISDERIGRLTTSIRTSLEDGVFLHKVLFGSDFLSDRRSADPGHFREFRELGGVR